MKLVLILLVMSTNSFAQSSLQKYFNSTDANKVCQQSMSSQGNIQRTFLKFIYSDKNKVYYAFRDGKNSLIQEVNIGTNKITQRGLEGRIQDIKTSSTEVYYLMKNKLYIANKVTGELLETIRTLPVGVSYSKYGHARGLYIYKNTIFFAHGVHGVSVYDRTYKKHLTIIKPRIPQPNSRHISMVTDIDGVGDKLYFAYDDVTLHRRTKPFEGIVIYSLEQQMTQKMIPVNQKVEAYYLPSLSIDQDEIIISNLHLNFRHKLSKIEHDKYMAPFDRLYKYDLGSLIGKGFISNKNIFGCFVNHNTGKIASGYFSF